MDGKKMRSMYKGNDNDADDKKPMKGMKKGMPMKKGFAKKMAK